MSVEVFGLDVCIGGIVDILDKGCLRWSCQAGGNRKAPEEVHEYSEGRFIRVLL